MPDPGRDARIVLGFGLGGDAGECVELDAGRSIALLDAMVSNRCVGLLSAAVQAEAVVLHGDATDRLARAERETVGVALMLERVLLETVGALERHGIDYRVLKGPSLAHTSYPEPGWRDFGDIDLLVHGSRIAAAVAALGEGGATRSFAAVGSLYERSVGKGVTMRTPEGWEIDLHRNIAHGPWGALIDPETLWGPRGSFALGGRTLPTLGPEAQLAHALVHAGLGSAVPRWANLRDIAQLSAAPELDRARVLRLLDRWRARVPASLAAAWSARATGTELSWLDSPVPPSRAERRWLALYRRPGEFRRLSLEALRAPIGWRARARQVVAMAPLLKRSSRGLRRRPGPDSGARVESIEDPGGA